MTSGTTICPSARVKGRPGLRLAGDDQRLGLAQQVGVGAGRGRELLDVAPGEQRQVVLADEDGDRLRLAARQRAQLQHEALGEVAGADAGRLHALQVAQAAAQPVEHRVVLGEDLVAGQALGDLLERIGQVAVVVERLDQDEHGRSVGRREAHAGELAAEVVLQARRRGAPLGSALQVVDIAESRAAGRLADAVEVLALGAVLPVVAIGGAEVLAIHRLRLVGRVRAGLGGPLGLALSGAFRRGRPLRHRLEGPGELLLGLEERIRLEHLLHLLVQLERRELQETDRLLQLRRQRQVLREPDLEGCLHAGRRAVPKPGSAPSRGSELRERRDRCERGGIMSTA
jgi:hypothetical protein